MGGMIIGSLIGFDWVCCMDMMKVGSWFDILITVIHSLLVCIAVAWLIE